MAEQKDPNLSQIAYEEILAVFQTATATDREALLSDFLIQTLFDYQFTGLASLTALNLQFGFTLLKGAPSLPELYFELSAQAIISPNKTSMWREHQKESAKARHQEFQFSPAKSQFVSSVIPVQNKQPILTCNTKILVESFNAKMDARTNERLVKCRARLDQVNKLLLTQLPNDSPSHAEFARLRDELRKLVNFKEHILFDPHNAPSVMNMCDQFFSELEQLRGLVKSNNQLKPIEAFYALDFWSFIISKTFLPFVRVAWLADKHFDRFDRWVSVIDDFLDDHRIYQLRYRQDKDIFEALSSRLYETVFGRLLNFPELTCDTIRGKRFNVGATEQNKFLMNCVATLTHFKASMKAAQQQYVVQATDIDEQSRTANKTRKTMAPGVTQAFNLVEYETVTALHELLSSVLFLGSVDLPDPMKVQKWDVAQCAGEYQKVHASLAFFESRVEGYRHKSHHLNLADFHPGFATVVQSVSRLFVALQQRCSVLREQSIGQLNRFMNDIVVRSERCVKKRTTEQKKIQTEIKVFCQPTFSSVRTEQAESLVTLINCFDKAQGVLSDVELLNEAYPEQDDIKAELDEKCLELTHLRDQCARTLLTACQTWFKRMVLCLAKPAQEIGDVKAQVSFLEQLTHRREQVVTMLAVRVESLPEVLQKKYQVFMQELSELTISEQHYAKLVNNAIAVLQGYQSEMQTALESLPSLLFMIKTYLVALRDDKLDSIKQQSAEQNKHIASVQDAFEQGCRVIDLLQSLPAPNSAEAKNQLDQLDKYFKRYQDYCSQLMNESANLYCYVQVKTALQANEQEVKHMLELVHTFEDFLVRGDALYTRFKAALQNAENHPTIDYYKVIQEMRSFVEDADLVKLTQRVATVNDNLKTMFDAIAQNVSYKVNLISDALAATVDMRPNN